MSKYTTEVRYICETLAGKKESVGGASVDQIIEAARVKIFDFNYPIFDNSYKIVLETKILRHFYTREIGLETYGLWKLKLESKVVEIMPFYNQLYKMEKENNFSLFEDVRYTTENDLSYAHTGSDSDIRTGSDKDIHDLTAGGDQTTTTKGDTETVNKYSATPQGGLNGLMNDEYLTEATVNTESPDLTETLKRNLTDTGSITKQYNSTFTHQKGTTDTDKGTVQVYGKQNNNKTFAELLSMFSPDMISIDLLVIEQLEPLFMQLW